MATQSPTIDSDNLSTYVSFPRDPSPVGPRQRFNILDFHTWLVPFTGSSTAPKDQSPARGASTSASGSRAKIEKYCIGQGQCGRVYTLPGSGTVVKLPKATKVQQLYNDARVHQAVCEAFQQHWKLMLGLSVPTFYRWAHQDDEFFWRGGIANTTRWYGLVAQRIPTVPRSFREVLVNTLCRKSLRRSALDYGENSDCLVRLYLGRRNTEPKREQTSFSMRNLPMHVNEMPLFGIDPVRIAKILARTLAVLHWVVRTDANDLEFVLSGAPEHDTPVCAEYLFEREYDEKSNLEQDEELLKRGLRIWLLDFNQCKIAIEDLGCTQSPQGKAWTQALVDGFFCNDPYYPSPISKTEEDRMLWEAFEQKYLKTSAGLAPEDWPRAFINGIHAEADKQRERAKSLGWPLCLGAGPCEVGSR